MHQKSAAELSALIRQRKFREAIRAYTTGNVDIANPDSLFQIALAYGLLKEKDKAADIRRLLPPEYALDVERDTFTEAIRDPTNAITLDLINDIEEYLTRLGNNPDRMGVAIMTLARAYRKDDDFLAATEQITEALHLTHRMDTHDWKGNIGFWALVIGNVPKEERTLAYHLTRSDEAFSRRFIAALCYYLPLVGRQIMWLMKKY